MILAIATRMEHESSEKPFDDRLYITSYFKKIFDDMGILLLPVISEKNLDTVTSLCEGLILPGSFTDINPSYYNHLPMDGKDYGTDEYKGDMALIKAFSKANKPILGICGGLQSINVYFGGTLHQQVSNHLTPDKMHKAFVKEDSFLYRVHQKDMLLINSFHNQAVMDVAPGFNITVTSEDGMPEAIERGNIIGVQWHPELLDDRDFFRAFVNLCIPK